MKFVSILGRQPEIGIAELERLYGADNVRWLSSMSAVIKTDDFDFERLGGSQKSGRVVMDLNRGNWHSISQQVVRHYQTQWSNLDHKITLGISAYGFDELSAREVQKTGIIVKQKLKSTGTSLRLLPNQESALNSATSHHNKLGLSSNKVELLITRASDGSVVVAESIGAQNITALAARDQGRPKRDAFVGMLPPKLAKIMVNLAVGEGQILDLSSQILEETKEQTTISGAKLEVSSATGRSATSFEGSKSVVQRAKASETLSSEERSRKGRLLDPFCGTGVLLQEALLMGFDVYGTDLSEKMIDYSEANLKWLQEKYGIRNMEYGVAQGDAMTHQWQQPIDVVASETYLGQPFSAPPSPAKLTEVRGNCDHIIRKFLNNIHGQLQPGTLLCLAVPAWKDIDGNFTHLPLINELSSLGYRRIELKNITHNQLIYHREDQVVARQLLLLERT